MTDFLVDMSAELALQNLLEEAVEQQTYVPPTGVQRKAATAAALKQVDLDRLLDLQSKMERVIDTMLANKIDLEHLGLLTPGELYDFMVEFLDQRDVKELLEVRYKMLREAIFAHITEENRLKGLPNPENTPGEVAVPKMGKKFSRIGGKPKAQLDEQKLAEVLTEDQWARITRTFVIPAVAEHIETVLDEEKIVAAVQADPSMLEVLRSCVVSEPAPTPRFMVKELKADEYPS